MLSLAVDALEHKDDAKQIYNLQADLELAAFAPDARVPGPESDAEVQEDEQAQAHGGSEEDDGCSLSRFVQGVWRPRAPSF